MEGGISEEVAVQVVDRIVAAAARNLASVADVLVIAEALMGKLEIPNPVSPPNVVMEVRVEMLQVTEKGLKDALYGKGTTPVVWAVRAEMLVVLVSVVVSLVGNKPLLVGVNVIMVVMVMVTATEGRPLLKGADVVVVETTAADTRDVTGVLETALEVVNAIMAEVAALGSLGKMVSAERLQP